VKIAITWQCYLVRGIVASPYPSAARLTPHAGTTPGGLHERRRGLMSALRSACASLVSQIIRAESRTARVSRWTTRRLAGEITVERKTVTSAAAPRGRLVRQGS